jgi:hypothetical protein
MNDFGEDWGITTINDSVFFTSKQYLFCWANSTLTYWENDEGRFYLSHNVDSRLIVQNIGIGILQPKGGDLVPIKGSEHFIDKRIHAVIPHATGYLACTRSNGFFMVSVVGEEMKVKPFDELGPKAKALNKYFIDNTFMIIRYSTYIIFASLRSRRCLSGEAIFNPG